MANKVVMMNVTLGYIPNSPPPPTGLVWSTSNAGAMDLTPDESGLQVLVEFPFDASIHGERITATLSGVTQAAAEIDYNSETGAFMVSRV